MNLRQLIENQQAQFRRCKRGIAYYGLQFPGDPRVYEFPVPLNEVGNSTLLPQHQAMNLWRFIQRANTRGSLRPIE